jgi:predicted O-methyltransferase YrrM
MLPKLMEARRIFEIGTLDGYTSEHFAMNSFESTEVFSLDLPLDQSKLHLSTTLLDDNHRKAHSSVKNYRFDNTPWLSKVHLLFGDSAKYDFSPFHNSIDLFFIDGAHSYEYVKSDTQNAIRCCRDGGMVVWHDYGRMGVNGVSRYLHELSANGCRIYSVPGSSLAYHFVANGRGTA